MHVRKVPSRSIAITVQRTLKNKSVFSRLGKIPKRITPGVKRAEPNRQLDTSVRNRIPYSRIQKGKGVSLRKSVSQLSLRSLYQRESYNRKIACWNCKKIGHHRRHCREAKKIFCSYCQTEDIRTQECRCRENLPGDLERIGQLMHEPLTAMRMVQIGSGYGLRINVQILQRNFTAIIDTGASTLLVGESVKSLCELHDITSTKSHNAMIILANNQTTEVSDIYHFEMMVGIKKRTVEALVLPGLEDDILIGLATLKIFGFEFTFGGQTVDENSPISEIFPEPYLVDQAL